MTGSGPFGIRGEYLLADKFGIGLDIGYNATRLKFTDVGYDNNGNAKIYNYDYSTSKLGVMATFNFHWLDNDNLDFYTVVGAGYGNRTFSFDSDDPNYIEESVSGFVPVAFKVGTGLRYFFTDNIGANVAVQIGQGGVINGGLSFKF